MTRLRCLHLHAGNLFGGVERILLALATGPQAAAWSFGLAFTGQLSEQLSAAGASVRVLGPARLSRPWTVWRARRRARQLIGESQPALVICHSDWSQSVYGPVVRALGLPLVRWLHAPPTGIHWLERWAARSPPTFVICNSRFTEAAFRAVDAATPSATVYPPVAPPPPPATGRIDLRRALGVPDGTAVILQVGRMERGKGHSVLLDAARRLGGRPDWTVWEVGAAQRKDEQVYVGQLALQAIRLGLSERVRFLGGSSDVSSLMAAADLYCQPNVSAESFGISFVEALYAGLPVVTSAIGGAREIVDESCGVLLPPGDPAALSGALGRLLDDPDLRKRLGAAGPARARQLCDPTRQLEALGDALSRVPRTTSPGS